MKGIIARAYGSLKLVYKPKYVAINIIAAVVYYLVLTVLIRYQNYGILIITAPAFLIYALVISSSMMFTIGVFSAATSIRKAPGASASTFGTAVALFSGIIIGCGCSAPILYSITVFGLSIAEVSVIGAFIAKYSVAIISAIIAINVLIVLYYSLRISPKRRAR